jgi:DNA helicase-2/ATP-dependent DNA helicase PcrA
MREFALDGITEKIAPTLFDESPENKWVRKLAKWRNIPQDDLKKFIEDVGTEIFEGEKDKFVTGKEIMNTILHLLTGELEKNPSLRLRDFISYLEKLEFYGEPVPLVTMPREGIKVLTMHSSKGSEFEYVWIAHMDERSLGGGKKMAFSIPENIKEKIEERDIDSIKRKLYVAITRAKRFCTLSYARESMKGNGQELAKIIEELPEEVFKKEKIPERKKVKNNDSKILFELQELVKEKYKDKYISASMLNNFFECPWKWYFRSFLQLPEAPTLSLEFGSKIHAALDKILKLGRAPDPNELKDLMLDEEAREIISRWVRNRLPQIKLNYKNEQSVSIKDERFPYLNVYGKLDLIENLGGNVVRVTDFKTGGVRKRSDIEKLDDEGRMSGNLRQLAMYSYLITKSPQWKVDVRESRLEFVEAKKDSEAMYDTVINNEHIDLIMKDIADYDELVKTGNWVNRECNYNSYGKNTECEYCKLAEVYSSYCI